MQLISDQNREAKERERLSLLNLFGTVPRASIAAMTLERKKKKECIATFLVVVVVVVGVVVVVVLESCHGVLVGRCVCSRDQPCIVP